MEKWNPEDELDGKDAGFKFYYVYRKEEDFVACVSLSSLLWGKEQRMNWNLNEKLD